MRSVAITKGRIADILQARGELDEALRIRTDEEIPVYERLGDKRSLAAATLQAEQLLRALSRTGETAPRTSRAAAGTSSPSRG